MREEVDLAGFIDHTLLKPEATKEDIARLCAEARQYNFAAVCVNPVYVKEARGHLHGSGVRIATVIGFPLGAATAAVKAFETGEAVAAGADEIDMVIHLGALKGGAVNYIREEITAVVKAACGRAVKVIIETGLLTDAEKIAACRAAKAAGAHFVKTSTGFGPGGATAADIRLIRKTIGPDMGIKASGGVRTREAALEMIDAGATRIGTSSGIVITGAGLPEVTIYTDGACSGNPGPGGWGAVIMGGGAADTEKREISGGELDTTNQRMELRAAIEALRALPGPSRVRLHSDSAYLINAFRLRWIPRWQLNGWQTKANKPVQNQDLWQDLLALTAKHQVEWCKVKGHSDDYYNNRCDELARGAIPAVES